jgi:hypothetical protein
MTRAEKVAKMRDHLHNVPEANRMIAAVMKQNGVATVDELSEKHPKQFNSLLAAIEVMEEEMPEPEFPWPKA